MSKSQTPPPHSVWWARTRVPEHDIDRGETARDRG